MPVPGQPRNPEGELPLRFRARLFLPIAISGESPGTKEHSLRGNVLAPGIVRALWRQTVDMIPAPPGFSWSGNSPAYSPLRAFAWSRSLRYMARSFFLPGGSDESRFGAPRALHPKSNRQPIPTIAAGVRQNRPTVRNRLSSFGSRVEPINPRLPAAVDGGGS